jgi:sRNA-binding protein
MRVIGSTLMVNVEGEGIKMVVVPEDFRFDMEGEKVPVERLEPGMILTGVKIGTIQTVRSVAAEEAEKIAEEEAAKLAAAAEEKAAAAEEKAAAAPAQAPAPPPPAPEPEPEDNTMRTVGLILLILIIIAVVIWFMRKKDV